VTDPLDIRALRALPKAEVHVHLEGCFESEQVERLARAAGVSLPRPPERLFEIEGLAGFLDFLDWVCCLVTTPEQLARAAYAFCQREAAGGVGYADVIVNPTHWASWRTRIDDMIDALDQGFTEAEQDGLPPAGLCVSLLRLQSASEAAELVERLLERRHPRVVALSIDGDEVAAGRTGPRFAEAFQRAAARGLHRTVHAGESSGPEGVRDAIDLLLAERIDHGVRSVEDPDLTRELADRRIALGVCPTSNVALGLYPDLSGHPLEELRRAGVRVSVNTDDPTFLGTSIDREYAAAAAAFDWEADTVRAVARTSIEAAFCGDNVRQLMLAALDRWEP
jgi:adenosine deaminase